MAEKIGSMLLAMAVRLVILRLLTPDILGFMSIPSAVATILLVVVDSGFSQSLIRHRAPSQSDYKSVFLFNMAVSLALYAALMALMPFAARWYDMPQIARIAPAFFLLLPLNALCAVQNTIFIRQFRFALLSKVTFASSLVGGFAAIGCALAGGGIWEPRGRAGDNRRREDRDPVVAERLAAPRAVQREAPARDGAFRVQSDGDRSDFEFLQQDTSVFPRKALSRGDARIV